MSKKGPNDAKRAGYDRLKAPCFRITISVRISLRMEEYYYQLMGKRIMATTGAGIRRGLELGIADI